MACHSSCIECLTHSQYCTACASALLLYRHTCVGSCPAGHSASGQQCLAYIAPCSSVQPCSSCLAGYFLLNGACLQNCPSTYFNDKSAGACTACSLPCITCLAVNRCLLCSMVVQNGQCQAQCTGGYLLDSASRTCLLCDARCSACLAAPSQCLACDPGYIYNPATSGCGSTCTAPFYLS